MLRSSHLWVKWDGVGHASDLYRARVDGEMELQDQLEVSVQVS